MKPYSTNCCDLPGQISLFDSAESGGGYEGYGAVAYRLVNAQYWGVPQRRRRVYACCDTGGRSADKILFERKSHGWNFEPCIPAGQTVAGIAGDGYRWHERMVEAKPAGGGYDPAYTMKIRSGCEGGGKGPLVQNDLSATLATHQDQTVFAPARDKCLPVNMMLATRCKALGRGTGLGVGDVGEPQYTITAGHEHAVAYENGTEPAAQTLTARADGSPMLDEGEAEDGQ